MPDHPPIEQPVELPQRGSWPKAVHIFDPPSAYAVRAALAAQRPLLVRGEPGTGKSQLARAAAEYYRRLFVAEVVHARSEPQDLQYRFDAVARLGEAQALGAGPHNREEIDAALDPLRYLSPGPLWWALDWPSAQRQHGRCAHPARCPEPPGGWTPEQGSVLLVDEIDKAEADLPNGLLETLGNGAFPVPYRDAAVCHEVGPPPLVVITTNEERELPGAFLRRCLVLQLSVPETEGELVDWLMRRGRHHFPNSFEAVRRKAAERLWGEREAPRRRGLTPPGQAEYLDLLRALEDIAPGNQGEQERWLQRIADFALCKAPPED
jgi:MoxR-like ATPase